MPHAKRLASHAQPIVAGRCLHMHYSSSDVQAFCLCCPVRMARHRLCKCASVFAAIAHSPNSPTTILPRKSILSPGPFTRQITTDFLTFAREPSLCVNACVTWLQGLPCTLVPQTFVFPYEPCSCCCDDDSDELTNLPDSATRQSPPP